MSANDQRPRGQPSHVSNGSGSKEEEAYLQQQPPHPMRAWGEQASDGGYGAGPMSTAVSDSFFPNYYPPNMSYPFMNQGMGGSEGAWSSGTDTMFGMGYDYSNMYGGFGFPFNNWDYSGDYWGSSQPVRKDQRGYAAEEAYYPPEMIPADSYGMVNGAPPPAAAPTATAAPVAESQEQVASVEQGIRDMRLAYRKDNMIPPQHQHQQPPPPQHQHQQQNQRQPPPPPQHQQPPQQQHQHQPTHHLQHVVAEGFTGEPSFMMPPSPVSATVSPSGGQSSIGVGSSNSSSNTGGGGDQSSGGQSSSSSSSKKTSWAAIASQPARPQLQMRPRTIPRAPVHPGKSHNMDIGTWDTRGNPSRPGPVPMTISQPLPNQPPSSMAARYSRQPLISQRQTMPPPPPSAAASVSVSNSSNNNNTSSSGGGDNSNFNSSSSYGGSGSNTGMDGGSGSGVHDNSNTNAANVSTDSGSGSGGNVVAAIGSGADSNNSNMASSGGGGNSSSSSYSGRYSSNNASGSAVDSANSRAVVNVNASMNGMHGSSGDSSSSPQAPTPVVDGSGGSSEKASSSTFYNPKEFVLNHKSARYFIIKSYSEDDIHRSIKYSVWCSTDHGNRRLDAAFQEREGKGPVYLIFSVNGSGHFCGVAQMMTAVDYNKSTGIWHQDKWKGQIEVKWVYVKDVPNGQLRHIRLENNENKPVTNSRDTQEVPPEKGKQVLRIMHSYKATTSIFDDFSHYEKRQEEDRLLTVNREQRGGDHRGERGGGHHGGERGGGHHGGDRRGGGGDRGDRGGDGDNYHRGDRDRDHHHHNQHHRGGDRGGDRDGRDNHHNQHHRGGGGGGNNDHRNQGGYRNDYNRGGDRDGGRGDRDNRDHHHQHHHQQRYEGGRGGGGDDRNDNNNRDRGDRGGPRGGFDREIRGRPGGINDREPRRGGFRQH